MKASELRDQTVDELQALLQEKQSELFVLTNKLEREKKTENPGERKKMRKDIARIHTILREKELAS